MQDYHFPGVLKDATEHYPKCSGEQHCPVVFVYLHPVDEMDPRRWLAGLAIVNHQREPVCNLHSHAISYSNMKSSSY